MYIATDTGHFVNDKFRRLAELIKDYDPALELGWIPTDKRKTDERYPYVVQHQLPGKEPYIIMYLPEDVEPHRVLTSIIMADNNNGSIIDGLEAEDAARKLWQMKEWNEKMAEGHDLMRFYFNTPLHYIKNGRDEDGKLIRMDETRRRI